MTLRRTPWVPAKAVLVACVAVASASIGTVPLEAEAASGPAIVQTAWFWLAQGGGVPAPFVPSGDLLVEGDPDGATAEGAILASVGSWSAVGSPVKLTLELDSGTVGVSTGSVWACPAVTRWDPGGAQPWSSRPAADCDRAVVGDVSSGGKSVSFEVGPLVKDGTLDVVLVPGQSQAAQVSVGSTFSDTFRPPTAGAISLTGESGLGSGAGTSPGGGTSQGSISVGSSDGSPVGAVPGPASAAPSGFIPGTGLRTLIGQTAGAGSQPAPGSAGPQSVAPPSGAANEAGGAGAPLSAVSSLTSEPRRTRWLLLMSLCTAALALWRWPSIRQAGRRSLAAIGPPEPSSEDGDRG